MALWNGLIEALESVLRLLHGMLGFFGIYAWGWAIIALTFAVRLVLLPLAVKQMNSMRAMQQIQPELKKIQAKYKTDRSLMRTDPDKYKARKQKQQQAMMELYREHNVNPAGSCLPLLLQMPIFFALFRVLNGTVPELEQAPFYLINGLGAMPSQGLAAAGLGAFALIVLQLVTTFVSQKQTMARTPSADPQSQQQQRVLLYAMPVMFTFFSFNLPVGVLLYWVATNLWTMAQQYVMYRNIQPVAEPTEKRPARQ